MNAILGFVLLTSAIYQVSNAPLLVKMVSVQKLVIDDQIVSNVKNAYDPNTVLLKWQINTEEAESQRHFLSQTSRLVFTCKDGQETREHSFFIKCAYDSSKYERYQVGPVVQKEFEMYKNILPIMKELAPFELPCPKCYYVHEDGSVILEDILQEGFQPFDGCYMDLEHAAFALKALAEFHAVSVKVDEVLPNNLAKIGGIEFVKCRSQTVDKNTLFGNRLVKLISRVDPIFASQNQSRLSEFGNRFYQTAVSEACRNDGFSVLNHGDMWTSNIMFKYTKGKITDVRMFDFQFSNWSSPANDLLLFFMMAIDFETFQTNFQYLLGVYADKLLHTMQNLGCSRSYTMKQLLQDIRDRYNFWILLLIWWGPIFHSTADEFKGDVLAEYLVDGKNYQSFLKKWMSFFIDECAYKRKLF